MELVYLWVEDYKNIKKQGFNFSSRFECKFYDEYEKDEYGYKRLKDNCNLEIKPKEHIENFFGKNINVTAIVGKNGSGKSSVLEYIIRNMYYYFYSDDGNTRSSYSNFLIFYDKKDNKLYILWNIFVNIKITNKTELICDTDSIMSRFQFKQNHRLIEHLNFNSNYYTYVKNKIKNSFSILHYDYSFSKFFKNDKTSGSIFILTDVEQLYEGHKSLVCFPNKNNKCKVMNNFNDIEHNDMFNFNNDKLNIIKILVDNNYINPKDNYFIPNIIQLFINDSIDTTKNCTDIFNELIKEYKEVQKDQPELIKKANEYLKILITHQNILNKYFTIENATMGYNMPIRYNFNIDISLLDKNNIDLITKLPPNFMNIDLIEGDETFGKRYEELSNGEKSVLKIIYHIENFIISQNKLNYFILLDEPANNMHPDWQKRLLRYLVDTFKEREQNIHFVFTTHSPFMISDLPKENIIFLKDGKNDKGINHKQTFGANIHTLLSDSFFMEDGLMGEFAKGKINEIKKLYQLTQNDKVQKRLENQKTKELAKKAFNRRKKRLWQIQKIIGELFLQRVIQNYLDELELLFSDDKTLIDKELVEIEERRIYLEGLKNAQN